MKKVNEKRWALVDETGETVELCDSGVSKNVARLLSLNFPECRVARVQITEIEEGEEDGKTI